MIDLADLRSHPEAYAQAAKVKRIAVDIHEFLAVDERRRDLLKHVEEMRAKRNSVSKRVPVMKGEEKEQAVAEMKKLGSALTEKEGELERTESVWQEMQLLLPNIPHASAPIGKSDADNREVKTWGDPAKRTIRNAKDHITLAASVGGVDLERGVKVAGARSYFLTGDIARLHLAVLRFTIDHLTKKGWRLFLPPHLVQSQFFMGTGFFPGAEEQIYAIGMKKDGAIESDDLHLIGTSEVSVMGFHADETLDCKELPKKYCGTSSCFRREAGTYGKDTHGLYRIHEFQKVEQVVLCEADEVKAMALFEEIRTNAEEVLQALELPYRVVTVCTGEMGRGKVFMQDIETWMPSRKNYGETHSCSYLGDFQTRRLNIKYTDASGAKQFCHSLNNTCIASPRILIPILEICQNADGSVTVPEVLRPYMNGLKKIG